MAIRTQESLSGFIAGDPELSFTSKGDARFYVRGGQNHYRTEDDGSFTKTDTTYFNLVAFRATAERAYERFRKGDNFIAEGYVRTYEHEVEGQVREVEEFVARRIGHDLAMTRYEVDRTPQRSGPGQDRAVEREGLDQAAAETPERRGGETAQRRDQLADINPPDTRRRGPSARASAVSL
ncbi:MAG: single-stranded DNA-binding protein [Acidimicrobiales bacterium]